jgi:hypothetical protein
MAHMRQLISAAVPCVVAAAARQDERAEGADARRRRAFKLRWFADFGRGGHFAGPDSN